MRILKFGGTSLGEAQTLETACRLIQQATATSDSGLVVVASAFSGVTDALGECCERGCRDQLSTKEREAFLDRLRARHLTAAHPGGGRSFEAEIDGLLSTLCEHLEGIALVEECSPKVRDAVLATGERLSVATLSARLQGLGVSAQGVDATELICAWRGEDWGRNEAIVDQEITRQHVIERLGRLPAGKVAVVTGFIAGGSDGQVLTLGRGASDYTATLLAGALEAQAVEIWTDVSGVLNACPQWVPEASPLESLSYGEAAEMASLGARVLHPKTLAPIARLGIPVVVRNTRRPTDPGTLIEPRTSVGEEVLAVTSIDEVCELEFSMTACKQVGSRVFAVLDRLQARPISVHLAVSGESSAWILRAEEADRAEAELRRELASELAAGGRLERRDSGAVIALIGGPNAEPSRLASELLSSLNQGGVQIRNLSLPLQGPIGQVARTALAVIDRSDLRPSARLLHESLLAHRASESLTRA